MDSTSHAAEELFAGFNSETDRECRLVPKARKIAEADVSIAAGPLVGAAGVDAWIDCIGTDHEPLLPHSSR
jgi:hypothetical protein